MRKKLFLFVISISALGVGLGLAEMILRWPDHPPSCQALVEAVNTPDPVLGWKNRAGRFEVLSFLGGGERQKIIYTNNPDGSRATAPGVDPTPGHKPDKIIIVGGSFTYGENVSDEQTFAWKLQEAFPGITVLNYGVRAYGTYQSLLMLEKVLPRTESPRIVIYGLILNHRFRNVAPRNWHATLNYYSRSTVAIPYVSLDKNRNLVRHSPETVPLWSLSRRMKTVYLCELAWDLSRDKDKFEDLDLITQKLILEMRDLCAKYKCHLLVAVLGPLPSELDHIYQNFFVANNIPAIAFDNVSSNMLIGGHPDDALHSRYAKHLERFISAHGCVSVKESPSSPGI